MPYPTNEWKKKYGDYKPEPQEIPAITNKMFAGSDKDFIAACELAGVKPTPCQGKKFRKKTGKAYKALQKSKKEN